ncbi:MAG: ABC transporter substrate-binding protein [Treponemataceae bacterium]|nr:MAG: ABC transporter substrate-binding protein [Treponemataceae bacterium]
MKRFSCVLLAAAFGTAMIFTSCTKKNAAGSDVAEGTLRWAFWGSENRIKASQAAIDAFQAENPGIVINLEVSGGTGDHFNKVDTQLAGGSAPDIIQMGGNFTDYIAKGVTLNLDEYIGTLLDTSSIDEGALEAGSVDGHLYAVSTGATIPVLVYNKTKLESYGAPLPKVTMTWSEFRDYLVAVKAKLPAGVYPLQDFGSTPSSSTGFGYFTRDAGTPIYDLASNSTKVTEQSAKAFLDLFADYRAAGLIPPADITAGYSEANVDSSSLIAGKAMISFMVSNQFSAYQGATTDDLGLIEAPNAAVNNALWPQLSQVYTVNANSNNKEAAVKFVNFLANSPAAGAIIGNDRGISSSTTFRDGAANVASDADKKVFAYHDVAGAHTSPETPHLPNDTELNSTLNLIYQNVAFGKLSTEQGAKDIVALLNRLINK